MPKSTKQRSVGIQSADSFDDESRGPPPRLVKKPGFRNLLRKSVTIMPEQYGERKEGLSLPEEGRSKSIQAATDGELSFQSTNTAGPSYNSSLHGIQSSTQHDHRAHTSGVRASNPGTSKMTSTFSAASVASQMNDGRTEGSLAVVYSYGGKSMESSMRSSVGLFRGSQGSRRYSDETILLIEDYQSYDRLNAARRQESLDVNRRRSFLPCCRRKTRRSVEILTRPLPLLQEGLETDEILCRICHEGEELEPLIQPCLCKGSVGSVHAKCLKVWLEQSNTSRCELCNYPYAIQQTKRYTKCVSVRVFYKTIVDRRSMAYDVISFVIITPLTLVGVVMCIQASVFSGNEVEGATNYQMGNITRAGMIMLSATIVVAYGVWLYTLISYHYKSWKKWYDNCYDVEVVPVRMTSEERLEAARRLSAEINMRHLSREQNPAVVAVLQPPHMYNFHQRRFSVAPAVQSNG